MPNGLPDTGATLQQDIAVPPVHDLPPGLQAPAQAAGGCCSTPEFQARSFETVFEIAVQAACLAHVIVLALHAKLPRQGPIPVSCDLIFLAHCCSSRS